MERRVLLLNDLVSSAGQESELWPNLLAACWRRRIPLMLMNARLSPRSYARWRRMPAFARMLLQGFDRIDARSEDDAERLCALGAREVGVPGDLKFAAPPLPAEAKVSWRAFASAITSATDCAGSDAVTVMTKGNVASRMTGEKSLTGS